MVKKTLILLFFSVFLILFSLNFVYANIYFSDVYFTIPDSVYITNENITLRGYVKQTNYSNNGTLVSNYSAKAGVSVNLTISNTNGTRITNYTFTTDANGSFYSKSNYYTAASLPLINAPSSAGSYYIRAEYKDPNGNVSFSRVEISVVNQTLDLLRVSSDKASYNPSEAMIVSVEAIKMVGDKTLFMANISVNGSLRNSTKSVLQSFNCTTGGNGKCTIGLTAPSTSNGYGNYILELNNFKAFGSFEVVPFSYMVYVKDDVGEGMKNVFAKGEQGMIEVRIGNASTGDSYNFLGYIADSNGVVPAGGVINSTVLNFNNSFTNTFLFTIGNGFSYGAYSAHVTVSKTGDGSIVSLASFQVQDWQLAVNKREVSSGFEYEYSTFPNKSLYLQALPTYRANGSVITNISEGSFTITLQDELSNILSSRNATWNGTCGKSGCYEISLTSPLDSGEYILYTTLVYNGDTQTESRSINIINGVMSAESTDKDGTIKELFGTNEYAYLSLSAYNLTSAAFNISNAEVFIVAYMNGSEFSYSQVDNHSSVNSSNSVYEWAWNSTLQRLKLDVPKSGGLYNVFVFGDNRTLGAMAKFIVNPYDVCSVPKSSVGNVDRSSSWYVWQFKTTDTVYFEIKMTQANNPSGRATAENLTGGAGNSSGMGGACSVDTTTKQLVSNATITLVEVKNLESGTLQTINTTESTCKASDSNGTYTCTVKPLSKWEGGQSYVKFNVVGQDGTTSMFYSRFEARAFYLYGWSSSWQNNPSNNITLNIQIYEAGSGWWGRSSGLSGSVVVKKVEYMGSDGEWIWPPVDSSYNVSAVNSTSISSSSYSNQVSLPVSNMPSGVWKTGNYRVVLQATTSSGDTDYGYAWFGVKLWDVYGSPVECTNFSCNYKNYFNSKENITLYITISKAGDNWWYWNYAGGADIYGNVSIGIKKIQNCRTWPCKELNSTQYVANIINVNKSSPGYWSASGGNQTKYIIQINSTEKSWGTAWYNVILDVNGTDTGYAWFNTIAFYVDSQPTNYNGSGYKYSIRGNQPMYFNVTTTKNYKSWWSGERYNKSDYVNVTLDSAVLRMWDQQTYKSKEFNYPTAINVTPTACNGNCLINVTYLNGTWPTGYYWGELTLKSLENESSTGWLWFNVQPFRVDVYSNTWSIDSDQCVNASLRIFDPDWNSWTPLYGNYSVLSVYENVWSGYLPETVYYANYSVNGSTSNTSSFNATTTFIVCPTSGQWSSGSWGGYHYLNILVKDNVNNDSQTGWLSFRTVPFQISWTYVGNVRTSASVNTQASLTKPSTGAVAAGNLTKLYQWRYDNYQNTREEYTFSVGNATAGICYSNVSGQCTVNGTKNVTIYPPSGGWKIGWNYIYAEWTTVNGVVVEDWSGIYFDGREGYNGWFDNYDANYNWKYYVSVNENITIKLNVRDSSYNSVNASVRSVEYAYSGDSCWSDWCRTYYTATYSPTFASNGVAVLNIKVPSTNWTKGYYAIRATVNGSDGTAVITGGTVKVKDFGAPVINITIPINNATYNRSLAFSATTSKNANCYAALVSYDSFYNWYCYNWNSTNSSAGNTSITMEGACNISKYRYNGSNYYYEYVYRDWHSKSNNTAYLSCSSYSGSTCYSWGLNDSSEWQAHVSTFMASGEKSHTYTFNISALDNQAYGIQLWCNDEDWNYVSAYKAFRVNNTV